MTIAHRFITAVAAGDVDAALALLHDDAVQTEMPNRLFPAGAVRDRAAMRAGIERGKTILSAQRYDVKSAVEHAGGVVVEAEWTGTTSVPIAHLPAGSVLKARIAQFFEVQDGRIRSIRNYDCYEAF